jgi:hypothetical protein
VTAIVQSGSSTTSALAATNTVTMTATSTSGSQLVLWGPVECSVAASGVTITVTDDKSNTWTVDAAIDPGGGDKHKVFSASCLSATAGTQVITINYSTGTGICTVAWAEVTGVTAVDKANTHGSGGGAQASPQTLTSSGANTTAYDLVLHALTSSGFNANAGYAAPCGSGGAAYTNVAVQQDTTSATTKANGTADYRINTSTVTDDAVDSWTLGNTIIAQLLVSYKGTASGGGASLAWLTA